MNNAPRSAAVAQVRTRPPARGLSVNHSQVVAQARTQPPVRGLSVNHSQATV
ncbi:hypothetical protein GCM10010517_50890 [Streptosporangium fragile]|uniref:Uncharacterized protein n=1 Tax=Streptosporangium fragile TaxID=46186 RepID=A0ABP6IKR0_9ACTN